MRRIALLLALCSLTISAPKAFAQKSSFPRTAAAWIARPEYQDPEIQRQLARADIALISIWPGWESGRGVTLEQVIRNIKAMNPNTLVLTYIINNEISASRPGVLVDLYAKIDAQGWYLYSAGGSGSIVDAAWPGALALNNTLHAPPDANGDRWVDWYAKWVVNQYSTPNPSLDGFNTDNVFWRPRVAGDYNRDGLIDSTSDATVQAWYRQGLARHFTLLKQLMPGKYQVGNIADWGASEAVLTEYRGLLHGGVLESMIGHSWSVEEWGGWQAMMAWYRKTMGALAEPKLGMFHQVGSVTDYRGFRYGFASCLMDDGYYVFNSITGNIDDAPFFDEYNAKLGNARSAPSTAAWQEGVYRRDFENGIVLVNPKGNGPQQLALEEDFRRLSGTQDPTVNNGQIVRTLTLQDRDGIVLMRTQAAAAPAAPTLLSVR